MSPAPSRIDGKTGVPLGVLATVVVAVVVAVGGWLTNRAFAAETQLADHEARIRSNAERTADLKDMLKEVRDDVKALRKGQ